MIRRHWKKILLGIVLTALVFTFVGLPYLLARLVTTAGTRPMDLALTSSPSDYGLDFEEVSFTSVDGVPLSGWYLGGADSDVVIACGHGLFRSRREVLDRAAFFRRRGFDTLVFDFRRHGTTSTDAKVTMGYNERLDFLGAAEFLERGHPEAEVVLYGVSMGAAAALLAARDSETISAVIADSSFLNFEHTVSHHVEMLFGLPRFPVASTLLFFFQRAAGIDVLDFDLERAVAALGDRPVLIAAGGDDRRMPAEIQRRLFEASKTDRSVFRVFPGAGHGRAHRTDPEGYERMLDDFLAGAVRLPAVDAPAAKDSIRESR